MPLHPITPLIDSSHSLLRPLAFLPPTPCSDLPSSLPLTKTLFSPYSPTHLLSVSESRISTPEPSQPLVQLPLPLVEDLSGIPKGSFLSFLQYQFPSVNEEILTLFLPEPISSNNRELKFAISSTYFLKEILLFSNPIFIEDEKHIFEKKNSCDIDKGLVTEGTKTDRKNVPCPFFTCFSYFKSVSLFRDHCSSFHPDFPIIFSFSLTKFQTDEKGILVNFMNSLYKTNSYKSKYSPEGRKSNNKKTTNIFTCNNLGNKFNCPSFFKFIKSSNNFDITVSFSLVHNHSEYTRKSLPANIRTELRAILENYEKTLI